MDKLAEIMAHKRREVAPLLRAVTESELVRAATARPKSPPFAGALRRADGRLAVIAEIKRRSPSAGKIKAGASAVGQARRYQAVGADALSVLTDFHYFGGTLDDLRAVTADLRNAPPFLGVSGTPPLPCLRKDFMIHPIQVLQACEAGASAILLIVRALADEEIKLLAAAAAAAGLDALFEIHDEPEIARALRHGARLVGVNNRDLTSFKTDLAISERLIPLLPREVVAVSESGIFTGADAARAWSAGAHAVLVGEALMKASNPAALIADMRAAR
jgi:indole-3-glycerol phosphate synthase